MLKSFHFLCRQDTAPITLILGWNWFTPRQETGDRKGSKANVGFSLSGGGCQDATVSGFAARTKSIEITESCRNSSVPAAACPGLQLHRHHVLLIDHPSVSNYRV